MASPLAHGDDSDDAARASGWGGDDEGGRASVSSGPTPGSHRSRSRSQRTTTTAGDKLSSEEFLRVKFNGAFGNDDDLLEILGTNWDTVDEMTHALQDVECNFFETPTAAYVRWLNYRKKITGSFALKKVRWSIGETNVLVGLHSQATKMAERPYDSQTGDKITRETRCVLVRCTVRRATRALSHVQQGTFGTAFIALGIQFSRLGSREISKTAGATSQTTGV